MRCSRTATVSMVLLAVGLGCAGTTRAHRMRDVIATLRGDLEESRQALEAVERSTSSARIDAIGVERWLTVLASIRGDLGQARVTLDELERSPGNDAKLDSATDRLTGLRNAVDALRELSLR